MTYPELLQKLYLAGYTRVERDDRLLDVLPDQTREKGIELWECWGTDGVRLLRVRLPYAVERLALFAVPRAELELLLANNETATLEDFETVATGEATAEILQ